MEARSPFENFSIGQEEQSLVSPEEARPEPNAGPPAIIDEEDTETEDVVEPREDYLVAEVSRYRTLTEVQKTQLANYMMMQEHGINVCITPLICKDSCPFRKMCPLFAMGEHPVTKPCPIESAIMKRYRDRLAGGLGIDISSDTIDIFDMKLIDDLAMIQMLKRRALAELAEEPATAEKVIGGYIQMPGNEEPQPFHKIYSNPRIKTIHDLVKLETKLMSELLATRKSKFQAEGSVSEPSKRAADLLRRMKDAKAAEDDSVIDADYVVKE